ncbi:class I SAM-dependent methyltransferase [Methylobacterium planeticum]|uniref:FkbM family methyltransferase n=1 Tax=Methylobacterium planeticum TaxID=2615211 RepID=A0A6N6MFI7_9HYPH|nr:hypothetical protein [Methylobacterium planeticum]KAB1069574.1 hypothetical protein F6X51_25025 [Methylobacterium planeticum]
MRPTTWRQIETVPIWKNAYRTYRKLPPVLRAPMRVAATPLWSGVAQLVLLRTGQTVASGPFEGITLALSPVSRRHLLSYLLGTTELEIWPAIERIIARSYDTIINIGAADGYYVVGFGKRMPRTKLVAYEAKTELHPALRHVAQVNGIDGRLCLRGLCTLANLEKELERATGPSLVLMDIEGAEATMLDPARVAGLRQADVLVETHEAFAPGCTESIVTRFSATHDILRYRPRPRVLADFPISVLPWLPRLFPRLAVDLMDERRTGVQEWLYMTTKTGLR